MVHAYGIPLQTTASGNTINIVTQYTSSSVSSSASNAGLASFNSTYFTVDANGFVSLTGSATGIEILAADSGSASGSTVKISGGTTGRQLWPREPNGYHRGVKSGQWWYKR